MEEGRQHQCYWLLQCIALMVMICGSANAQTHVNTTRPSEYPLDTAKLYVMSSSRTTDKTNLWGVSSNCDRCLRQPLVMNLDGSIQIAPPIDTNFPFSFHLVDEDNITSLQLFEYHFGDRGVYTLFISEDGFDIKENLAPYHFIIPVVVALCSLGALAAIWIMGTALLEKWKSMSEKDAEDDADDDGSGQLLKRNTSADTGNGKPARLVSLDAFRGLCIVVMIFVNYGGGGYWFFNHSAWNGLTVADLVFPWFIWIMGTSMALSLNSIEARKVQWVIFLKNSHFNTPKIHIMYKVIRRSIILFALGLFLNNGYVLQEWRIPGVLQRFAIAYFVVSLIAIYVPKWRFKQVELRGGPIQSEGSSEGIDSGILRDLIPYWSHWLIALGLVFTWLMITFLLYVPGCGRGYIGAGGIADLGEYKNCTGGAAGYIDRLVFGEHHIYTAPTCQPMYLTGPYDPEGLLGNLTSIFLCYLGFQSGRIIVHFKGHASRIKRWLVWGVFLGTVGTLLCEGQKNIGWIPLNKNLWSLSFVLVMAGGAFVLLPIFYFVIDVKKWWNGSPLKFVGMNPILIYLSHEILAGYFPFGYQTANTHAALLTENLIGVSCWCIIAYKMYQLKFFVNI